MKRTATLFILSLLLLQVGGCYIYFVGRLAAIRTEMREQLKYLPEEELARFQFTEAEFKKVRVEDHEIKVDGKMYDIARIIQQGNHILVLALHDEAEDNLLSFLNELVKRSTNDKKPIPEQLINLLALEFLIEKNTLPVNCSQPITHQSIYQNVISTVFHNSETPPPRG